MIRANGRLVAPRVADVGLVLSVFLLLLLLTKNHHDGIAITTTALTLTAGQRIAPRARASASVLVDSSTTSTPNEQRSTGTTTASTVTTTDDSGTRRKSLWDLPAVEEWASQHDLKEHHLKALYRALLLQRATTSDDAAAASLQAALLRASFPQRQAAELLSQFAVCGSTLVERRESAAGGQKLVVRLGSTGQLVETVLIRHESARSGAARWTVCVSSQVGCARACTFCATGTLGLRQNLSSGEILEQVWWAMQCIRQAEEETEQSAVNDDSNSNNNNQQLPRLLRNVVFMGQGEPLDNWSAVHEACRGLTHQCLFRLKAKHVTISTVGASPHRIRLLADEAPTVSLAISLHGATPELRTRLMPATAPLLELAAALDYHARVTRRGAMVEYLLIRGVNDSDAACAALVAFCHARAQPPYVNLIPYNPTAAGAAVGYQTPSDAAIHAFHRRLRAAGVTAHVRWSAAAGRDAQGACGQLALSMMGDGGGASATTKQEENKD